MRAAAALALIGAVGGTGAAAAAPISASDAFARAFSTKGEPASLHASIDYRAGDGIHHAELWRDGDRRLAKVTDGRLATYAFHTPGDADYRLTVLDRDRRIRTDIDRTDLYRIGNFSDWFDLAHGLRHPKARYTLAATGGAKGGAVAPCRWYALTEPGRTTRLCWSQTYRFPLLVEAGGRTVWRVASIDTKPIAADRFHIADAGYARYDAGRDIERD